MTEMSRRTFLWVTGGSSIALVTDPPRKLVNKLIPAVIPPEQIRPGLWTTYATTCRECPAGCGMHLYHRDGRATKAEGNPEHPVNRGALCPRGQSALQGVYDPDRLRQVLHRSGTQKPQKSSWDEALLAISSRLRAGGRVAVISSLQTGSLADLMKAFVAAFGPGQLLFHEAFDYEPLRAAHQQLFGAPVIPRYELEKSDFILSFAADFLETWVSPVSFARQFAEMHAYREGAPVGRMAYVGPRLSMTASNADTFVQVPAGQERVVAAWLLKIILDHGWQKNDISFARGHIDGLIAAAGKIPGLPAERLVRLAEGFATARAPVALAGPVAARGPVATDTAMWVALLNHAVGSIGNTVDFSRPHALSATAREAELTALLGTLGPNDLLFVHDTNPAYVRAGAAAQLSRAGILVYLGTMPDETSELAHWVLPVDSPLQSWGDYQPEEGIRGAMQPVMGRLYDTRSAGDVFMTLARLTGRPLRRPGGGEPLDFAAWVREQWGMAAGGVTAEEKDRSWEEMLRKGGDWSGEEGAAGSPPSAKGGVVSPGTLRFMAAAQRRPLNADEAELWPWGSIMLFDGRLSNRGWLQEAPDPVTFIVWGNWVDLHPRQAAALEIEEGDLVQLTTPYGSLRAPARVTEEVSEQTVAIGLGQGHTALGKNARGVGANTFALLGPSGSGSMFGTCRIRRVSGGGDLTRTASGREQLGRDLLRSVALADLTAGRLERDPHESLPVAEGYHPHKDMYPPHEHRRRRWAMVIDLQRCIGCGACTVACYAENNIPVVGKELVGGGREMAWLRVAPYRVPGTQLRYAWLPLHCQHCDAAPCEPVCPVFAAVHNEEGLNAQIYNRCIGTRYCSNNCPYKVRRFNWVNLQWQKPLDLQLNPEVTVRQRGVMEKCTFCVQRIRQAEYRARRERRDLKDGEVVPACAQTCPARVFTFGDLLDPGAEVTRLTRSDPRRYHLLGELNTKPAVTFLRRVDAEPV